MEKVGDRLADISTEELDNQCEGKEIPSVQDPIMLTVKVKVPINANAFSFDFYFFTKLFCKKSGTKNQTSTSMETSI